MTSRYFNYIAELIAAAKAKADAPASQIGHHGIEGEIREIAIRNCINPFLTQSYQFGTGKIVDSSGFLSDQIDLAVYHRKVAPPILINRDLGFFPVECVRYAFEIKSTLTTDAIRDADKKFMSIRRLTSFPRLKADGSKTGGPLPSNVLFAFSSDTKGSEIERYIKHTANEHAPPVTVLCVLGKGYWWYDPQSKQWCGSDTSQGVPLFTEFCMFMTGFMNTLAAEETSMRPFQPGSYINVADVPFEPQRISRKSSSEPSIDDTKKP